MRSSAALAQEIPSISGVQNPPEDDVTRLSSLRDQLQGKFFEELFAESSNVSGPALLWAMLDKIPDYIFIKDIQGRFVAVNGRVAMDFAVEPRELIGKTDFDLHPRERAAGFFEHERHLLQTGEPMVEVEEHTVDAAGNDKYLLSSKTPLRNERGEIVGLVGVARDITEQKKAQDEIRFLAHHDPLTRLPNRALLVDRLEQAILKARRSGQTVTIVFVDLDGFKLINDSLGHDAGDELLKAVAKRMVETLRATDTVARLGGDEFVILLAGESRSPAATLATVDKVRRTIAEPVTVEGQSLHVTGSMGVATFPFDGDDAVSLLKNADTAMYRAKEAGRNSFQTYIAGTSADAHRKLAYREDLQIAVEKSHLELKFQPQLDLASGRIFAVEALVSWRHPDVGIISPSEFIPIAEESGLIVPIGDWVLATACRQARAWQDAGLPPIRICVNVSARQFNQAGWLCGVKGALEQSRLEPKYLELELTESLLMRDVPQATATMNELTAMGVHFAIDDFGIGYSNLSALKQFPVTRLKIDRSFILSLPHDRDDRSIAGAIIALGHNLGMKVLAEGVETDEQLAFLLDNGCDEFQGFHFSKPLEPDELAALLTDTKRHRAPTRPAVGAV